MFKKKLSKSKYQVKVKLFFVLFCCFGCCFGGCFGCCCCWCEQLFWCALRLFRVLNCLLHLLHKFVMGFVDWSSQFQGFALGCLMIAGEVDTIVAYTHMVSVVMRWWIGISSWRNSSNRVRKCSWSNLRNQCRKVGLKYYKLYYLINQID